MGKRGVDCQCPFPEAEETRYTTKRMANFSRVLAKVVVLSFATMVHATEPQKKKSGFTTERGTSATEKRAAEKTAPPLQDGRSKKKKLLRPGVEWEPAPAPFKW